MSLRVSFVDIVGFLLSCRICLFGFLLYCGFGSCGGALCCEGGGGSLINWRSEQGLRRGAGARVLLWRLFPG